MPWEAIEVLQEYDIWFEVEKGPTHCTMHPFVCLIKKHSRNLVRAYHSGSPTSDPVRMEREQNK